MDKIFYFSGSGKSLRFSEYLSEKLSAPIFDITKISSTEKVYADSALVVFPVYCQNLPDPVKNFLPKLHTKKVAFAALYGRKSYGNVIEDAVNLTYSEFIGGVCVPSGHSFLNEQNGFDFDALSPFIERMNNPVPAKSEHGKKDFYADLIPAQRTRIGVKIIKKSSCDNCGKCEEDCPINAIKNGTINKNCIRCLRCVNNCPQKALEFNTLWFMKIYLENGRRNNIKFYL